MRLFLSERDRARLRWRRFGRPYLLLVGVAALVGMALGLIWIVAGLLHFHPIR
jgi:hypothetical protein